MWRPLKVLLMSCMCAVIYTGVLALCFLTSINQDQCNNERINLLQPGNANQQATNVFKYNYLTTESDNSRKFLLHGSRRTVTQLNNSGVDINGNFVNTKPVFIDIDRSVPEIDAIFSQLVVVTAFSRNHVWEGLGMIATVQKVMPHTPIVVYDIGLEKPGVIEKVKRLCNVELRTFEFKKYPPYVSVLLIYAWKVIIIKETLNEFGAIFWADASVRFTKSLRALLPFAVEHHGYLSRIQSYMADTTTPIMHNYFYTNDHMFKAFGIDKEEYFKSTYAPHLAANRQLIINSSTIQQNYVRPMYACALNVTCISPPGARHGNHRFDASALMLVFHKYFPGEFSRENDHLEDFDDAVFVYRGTDDWHTAKRCHGELPMV